MVIYGTCHKGIWQYGNYRVFRVVTKIITVKYSIIVHFQNMEWCNCCTPLISFYANCAKAKPKKYFSSGNIERKFLVRIFCSEHFACTLLPGKCLGK